MKVSDIVDNKIRYFKKGYVFTYAIFILSVKNIGALRMALDRLVESGKIVRLAKGQFYKPETDESGIFQSNKLCLFIYVEYGYLYVWDTPGLKGDFIRYNKETNHFFALIDVKTIYFKEND